MTEERLMLSHLSEIVYQLQQAAQYASMAYGRQIDSHSPAVWIKAMREQMLKAEQSYTDIIIKQQEEELVHAAE